MAKERLFYNERLLEELELNDSTERIVKDHLKTVIDNFDKIKKNETILVDSLKIAVNSRLWPEIQNETLERIAAIFSPEVKEEDAFKIGRYIRNAITRSSKYSVLSTNEEVNAFLRRLRLLFNPDMFAAALAEELPLFLRTASLVETREKGKEYVFSLLRNDREKLLFAVTYSGLVELIEELIFPIIDIEKVKVQKAEVYNILKLILQAVIEDKKLYLESPKFFKRVLDTDEYKEILKKEVDLIAKWEQVVKLRQELEAREAREKDKLRNKQEKGNG